MRAPVGGLFRHVRDLALEQVKWGLEVGVLFDANSSDGLTSQRLSALEPHLPLGLHSAGMGRAPGLGDLRCIAETRRLSRELQIDVLHGHGAKGGLYARLGGIAPGGGKTQQPLRFYTPHGGSLHYFDGSVKGAVFRSAEENLLRVTDGLIFESAFARDAFQKVISLDDVSNRVIHNGLTHADFEMRTLRDDAAEFVFVGELRHLKGVDVLLNALHRLSPISARAVIVGDGPDAAEFRAQANRLGLGARVKFTGAMPAREAFSLGKILVMPSRAESLPYVALEAAAAGLPLIATKVGGVAEIVEGSDTRLVPAGDDVALSCAMAHAADDYLAANQRAGRLREVVGGRFTTERMMKSVLEFYRDGLLQRNQVVFGDKPGAENIYLN
ncbi:MAG: glycosyltransferase family 4 protein [Alphaproteobacteria bacterium]|nr:glycosyltransferase family 4 protein [Alphaproteobacteria bacterium]